MKKRLIVSVLLGALLGIFCIIGIGFRLGFDGNGLFLFSAWYNRVLMGLLIGLAAPLVIVKNKYNPIVRGLLLGLIVSYSWYVASGNRDTAGFAAGIAYGVIIDWVATKYSK
jgi:Mg/Co/Ni transporter MgtE